MTTYRERITTWWHATRIATWWRTRQTIRQALRHLPQTTAAVAQHSMALGQVGPAFGNHAQSITNLGQLQLDILARLAAIEELLRHTGPKRGAILKRLYERALAEYQLKAQQPAPPASADPPPSDDVGMAAHR